MFSGAPNGKFWEKDLKTTKKRELRCLKLFQTFWDVAWKNLSVPHSQQDWWRGGLRATFIPSVGGGGRAKRFLTDSAQQLFYPSNHLRHHNFPISKGILFCPNLPASKNLPEEQIFWGTDPLGAPVFWGLCNIRACTLKSHFAITLLIFCILK